MLAQFNTTRTFWQLTENKSCKNFNNYAQKLYHTWNSPKRERGMREGIIETKT